MRNRERHSRNARPALALTALLAMMALMALTAAAAQAQPPEPGLRGDPDALGPGPGWLAERLDLSEEQVAKIDRIRADGRQKAVELRKQMMRLRNEMEGEMLADSPSRRKVLELNEQLGEVQTQMHANRLEERLSIRELLTPEQRDRMLLTTDRGRRGPSPRGGDRTPRPDCPRVED